MAKETQTQTGRCPTHGTVEATREVPKMGFPVVYFAIVRSMAPMMASAASTQPM